MPVVVDDLSVIVVPHTRAGVGGAEDVPDGSLSCVSVPRTPQTPSRRSIRKQSHFPLTFAIVRTSSMSSTPSLGRALQTLDIICEFANAIQNKIHNLIADGVMAASKFIGSIFFPGEQMFRAK